jgi:hypothetical protein
VGKALAPLLEQAVTHVPGWETSRIHPSQVDFAIQDVLGGLGQQGLRASDVLSGRAPRTTTPTAADIPVAGSALGSLIRGTGGQQWQDVSDPSQMMAEDVRQRMRSLGDYYEPQPVPETISLQSGQRSIQIPLRRAEQVDYQRLVNDNFNRIMRTQMNSTAFENEAARNLLRGRAMDTARQIAQRQVLAQVSAGGSNLGQRLANQSSAY